MGADEDEDAAAASVDAVLADVTKRGTWARRDGCAPEVENKVARRVTADIRRAANTPPLAAWFIFVC
jgi:hypothetical protein